MMYTKTKLYCQGQVLGLLERNDNIYTFTYDDEWIERKSFAICPQMPVCHDVYTSEHLFSVFKDAMPDAWGKKIILIAENYASILAGRSQKPLFDFDYFLRCDNLTRQGAIKVGKQEKANIPQIDDLSLLNVGKLKTKMRIFRKFILQCYMVFRLVVLVQKQTYSLIMRCGFANYQVWRI